MTHKDTTALTMTNPGSQTNVASDSVTLPVQASDPDGKDSLTYSATNLPDGLSIDSVSGIISGTLAEDAPSTSPYAVTVTADDGNGQTVSQTFNWLVNAPAITAQPASPVSAIEGNDTGSITVATFTTPDLNSQAGDFTVTINWGDGTAPDMAAVVTGGNGSFTVTDDHVYAEKGNYTVSVQISNSITGSSATTSTTATVTDAPLTLTGGFELGDAMDNPPGSFTLATFTDANPSASPIDYLVSIDWGDGSPLDTGNYAGSIGDGLYSIMARHTYMLPTGMTGPLTFGVAVTLTDVDGAVANTSSTVVVGQLVAQVKESMGSWVFEDANTYSTTGDFVSGGRSGVAAINWGDNSSSLGTLSGGPGDGSAPVDYLMLGNHTYADSLDQPGGVFAIGVTATDVDGASLSGTQYVSVVRPPVTVVTGAVETGPGLDSLTLTNTQIAAFTVPNSVDAPGEFSATIKWGDNTSSSGTIQEVGPGLFQVLGSHTYTNYGLYTITVTVKQGWGGAANAAVGAEPAQAGAPNKGIVFPKTIYAADTPQQMVDKDLYRIAPRRQVGDWNYSFGNGLQYPLEIKVMGQSADNGRVAFFNGGFSAIELRSPVVAKEGDFWLTGLTSTKATNEGTGGGNAGKLYVAVFDKNGKELARTAGFSVAAIPLEVTQVLKQTLNNTTIVNGKKFPFPFSGFITRATWDSDSLRLADLDSVGFSEQVEVTKETGVFVGTNSGMTGYQRVAASIGVAVDSNAFLTSLIGDAVKQQKTSITEANQVFIFWDRRTGGKNIPFAKSGFHILYQIQITKDGKLDFVRWFKEAKAVTANKFASAAGTTDPKTGIEYKIP